MYTRMKDVDIFPYLNETPLTVFKQVVGVLRTSDHPSNSDPNPVPVPETEGVEPNNSKDPSLMAIRL